MDSNQEPGYMKGYYLKTIKTIQKMNSEFNG